MAKPPIGCWVPLLLAVALWMAIGLILWVIWPTTNFSSIRP